MEFVEAWLSLPIVQLAGVLLFAFSVILLIRWLRGSKAK